MKFSEQWLREWVNPAISTEELAHQLTMAGLEVDAIEPVAAEFDKVVVGEVLKVEPHPDADKLRVCQVNVGEGEALNIVCGAANVREGLRVPTALVGATLPGGLKIKKSKLRGVPSHGMLCSEKELGLAESADGLMELPPDAPIGENLREYLQLDDVSIELGLTPNRGDCLSVAGIARETGVINKQDVKGPAIPPVAASIDDTFAVSLEAEADCPHYVGRVIREVNPQAKTPLWMQEKLRRSGIRSLGPVVDVTNYILLELGQPMHAFDLNKLTGSIQVRHAQEGEKLILLDEQEITLSEGSLVIADEAKPLALAGIMGGLDSAVSDSTIDIFLESAYFNPLTIAGRARSYGLHTDSSHRFERGVAADLQRQAIERATALLLDIVGGQAGPVIEQTAPDQMPLRVPVTLRAQRIKRVLGTDIPAQEVNEVLSRLGMKVESTPEDSWQVTPPAFRFDINIEEDLIEELGRIHGYDQLPSGRPQGELVMIPQPEARLNLHQIREVLVRLGYQEAVTYSFVDPKLQTLLDPQRQAVELANPLSSDMSVMRSNLWPGLVQTAIYNLNRQQNRLLLFECGLSFIKQKADLKQEMKVAGLITGEAVPEQWGRPARKADFYDLKAHVESLLALTGRKNQFSFQAQSHPVLHPGQSAAILNAGRLGGWLGALHPSIARELGLSQQIYVFELVLSALIEGTLPSFAPLSKYPAIRRDIAVVVDQAITAQQVQDCIRGAASANLREVKLFDLYVGEGIDSGRKSLALGLTLQDLSRTLKDTDVDNEINKIVGVLTTQLRATLRE